MLRPVTAGKLVHDGHPILSWNAANAVVQSDPSGNRNLTKEKSRSRIDGMVALAMAVATAITHENEDLGPSVYEVLARQPKPASTSTSATPARLR